MKKVGKLLLGAILLCSIGGKGVKNENFTDRSYEEPASLVYESEDILTAEVSAKVDLQTSAKAVYLMDFGTQTPMYACNEEKRLPIASMCKIMTLLLSFDEIKEGKMTLDEEIGVSEHAASMGGSQVFLEANGKYTVENLIKSVVVCSANDSCVALAERIAGSESLFVDQMNEKAKEIGAYNTLFANCTGLPKEPQYSCAKDVAIMLKNLLQYEEYYRFGKVWMDKFQHPEGRYTEISNTNKLVRFYDGCDGGKTGFTNEAGFCLAATAKRNDLRIISVVIGEETSATRFEDVKTMFDYAFANYTNKVLFEEGVTLEEPIALQGGKQKTLLVRPMRCAYSLEKKGEKANIVTEIYCEKVVAPISEGEKVGELVVFKDGVEVDRIALLASENVGKANFFDRLQEIARNWNG